MKYKVQVKRFGTNTWRNVQSVEAENHADAVAQVATDFMPNTEYLATQEEPFQMRYFVVSPIGQIQPWRP